MLPLSLGGRAGAAPLNVLVLGAHSDDAEIGCGGTILRLIADGAVGSICWVVLSGRDARAEEARASAEAMLEGVPERKILQPGFRDGFFPYEGADVKGFFEDVKRDFEPTLILTHQRHDLHQDHRLTCELTWNTFRNHLVLEYEVPKYDGDMGRPNFYVPIDDEIRQRKIDHLMTYFGTQAPKHWFKEELFAGLLRLRGMECNSPTAHAEAFYSRKAVLA
jgi:LmbE family N-acetylglucosaminyl deacetylase